MKTAVIGSGSWGTALANVLAQNGEEVLIYGIHKEEIDDININHRNSRFFQSVNLDPRLKATGNFEDLKDFDIFLLAVPSIAIEDICLKLTTIIEKPVYIINVAKGFHPTSHKFLMDVIEESIDSTLLKAVVSLIGPSHAEEVVLNQLTAINAVSKDLEAAKMVQELFSNETFRVYTNNDIIGAQVGVAIKNIIALASGVASGLGYGDNTRAALVTRGLAEMSRFGVALGGQFETFLGLCGVGDLVVTAMSPHSRNFQAGYQVAKDGNADNFNKSNKTTVEGVKAAKIVYEESKKRNIEMPITEQVYKVFYENKDPNIAIKELMTRDLKHEILEK